jgi:hypothetical protein
MTTDLTNLITVGAAKQMTITEPTLRASLCDGSLKETRMRQ